MSETRMQRRKRLTGYQLAYLARKKEVGECSRCKNLVVRKPDGSWATQCAAHLIAGRRAYRKRLGRPVKQTRPRLPLPESPT